MASKYIQCCELLSMLGSYQQSIDASSEQEHNWFAVFSYTVLKKLNEENRLCSERCKPFYLKVELSQLNKTF